MAATDAKALSLDIYRLLVDIAGAPAPGIRLWDGTVAGDNPDSTIVLTHDGALRSMLVPPSDLVAAEAYIFGDVDIEGDVYTALDFARRLDGAKRRPVKALRLLNKLRQLPEAPGHEDKRPARDGRVHSRERDQEAVRAHYDTGNEFFRSFLDSNMVYSCAYFLTGDEDLEVAQLRKLDVVARKLQLAPGQRILDVGCGWGAFLIHAAQNYDVDGVGITLSSEQALEAEKRVKEAGLADRVEIRVQDYRDVDESFDAIASVGMFEHVGEKELARYFSKLFDLLTPRGIMLNHGITTRDRSSKRGSKPTFVSTYVFPDGELSPFEMSLREAEGAGFRVRDVEALGPSYALTLRNWVAKLERSHTVDPVVSEEIYRIWRSYMAGSAIAFELGGIDVYQMVAHKPQRPWTFGRSHMIASDD